MELLHSLLRQRGLERAAHAIAAQTEPCVRLASRAAEDGRLPVGATKLGGAPDLPPDFAWPSWKGDALAFIAQIDTASLPAAPFLSVLPERSLLSFFYDAGQSWGSLPEHRGSCRVFAFPMGEGALERRPLPDELYDAAYRACSLTPTLDFSLPDIWSRIAEKLPLSEEERELYGELYVEHCERRPAAHQLLGHADQIQNDMQVECQLVTNGVTSLDDPRRAALEAGADEWRLLLQVISDEDAGMMWGDVGTVYFWIRDAALRTGDFSEVWTILQCM